MLTINLFITKFEEKTFQLTLERIHNDLAGEDPEEWALELYLLLRDHPMDSRASSLNRDRKVCLLLLYEMVDIWEASADPDAFEQDIREEFGAARIQRILEVCLIMDRAQCLNKLQIPNSSMYGMHWYSKLHLAQNTHYARTYPEEQAALKSALESYEGSATMNKRLFKLLFTPSFGLLQNTNLARWSRPTLATFIERPPLLEEDGLGDSATANVAPARVPEPAARPMKRLKSILISPQEQTMNDTILQFVQTYDAPVYQTSLERLHHDKGSQDPETWAKNFYLKLRDYPNDPHLCALDQDRRQCLQLLYALVDAWQDHQEHGLGSKFEHAMMAVFKVRRFARILSVCLVMDRARALYEMRLPCDGGGGDAGSVGMHWYSELHEQNQELCSPEWTGFLRDYRGHATMNKHLYQLLHSNVFGLQQDPYFAKWSQPQAAMHLPGKASFECLEKST